MAKKRKGKKGKAKEEAKPIDPAEYLRTMLRESDRGCLLVGLAQVDYWLKQHLLFELSKEGTSTDAEWLLDERPGNRPLSTLAVRTRMARCLGIINDEFQNTIDGLRGIRNQHAHGTTEFVISDNDLAPIWGKFSTGFKFLTERLATQADTLAISSGLPKPRRELMAILAMIAGKLEALLIEHQSKGSES